MFQMPWAKKEELPPPYEPPKLACMTPLPPTPSSASVALASPTNAMPPSRQSADWPNNHDNNNNNEPMGSSSLAGNSATPLSIDHNNNIFSYKEEDHQDLPPPLPRQTNSCQQRTIASSSSSSSLPAGSSNSDEAPAWLSKGNRTQDDPATPTLPQTRNVQQSSSATSTFRQRLSPFSLKSSNMVATIRNGISSKLPSQLLVQKKAAPPAVEQEDSDNPDSIRENILTRAFNGDLSVLEDRPHCISVTVCLSPDAALGLSVHAADSTDPQSPQRPIILIKHIAINSVLLPEDQDDWIRPGDRLIAVNDLILSETQLTCEPVQEYLDTLKGPVTLVVSTLQPATMTGTASKFQLLSPILYKTVILPLPKQQQQQQQQCADENTPWSVTVEVQDDDEEKKEQEVADCKHDEDGPAKMNAITFCQRKNRLRIQGLQQTKSDSSSLCTLHPNFPPIMLHNNNNNVNSNGNNNNSSLQYGDFVIAINHTVCLSIPAKDSQQLLAAMMDGSPPYLSLTTLRPSPSQLRWMKIRRTAAAVGGGTLVGVGAVIMATPLHPLGHAMAIGGAGVLGAEFEAPKRVLASAKERFSRSTNKECK